MSLGVAITRMYAPFHPALVAVARQPTVSLRREFAGANVRHRCGSPAASPARLNRSIFSHGIVWKRRIASLPWLQREYNSRSQHANASQHREQHPSSRELAVSGGGQWEVPGLTSDPKVAGSRLARPTIVLLPLIRLILGDTWSPTSEPWLVRMIR